jgi:type VI secretion system protein ImpG
MSDPVLRKQVDAVRNVTAEAVMRRVPAPGPISFARGLGITVNLEERGFEGTGVFVLGAVLEQFFARYVGLNGFTETTIRTVERGEVMRWPVRLGRRPMV